LHASLVVAKEIEMGHSRHVKPFEQLLGKVVRSIARHGVVGSFVRVATWPWLALQQLAPGVRMGHAAATEQSKKFDRDFGVDTAGKLGLAGLDIVGDNRHHGEFYLGSPPALVREALTALPIAYENFAFVDYGSGKGRALFVASEFPFKYIIGVEFAAELHLACEANLKAYRNLASLCRDIRPVHEDAATFDPPEDPLVLFFYNPFDRTIFDAVINRLEGSLRRHPRPVWIVYNNPKDRGGLDDCQFLEEVSSTRSYSIYRTL
jgi:SAM-dependent methyltransferase